MSEAHDQVVRFRAFLASAFGLAFDESKNELLAQVLERQAGSMGAAAWLQDLETRPAPASLRAMICDLTVAETYFFRHTDQFRALVDVGLPQRLAANSGTRRLSMLSAGCATGEEPYTLAILVRQQALAPAWNVSIRAVDVNPAVLERAKTARYSSWALREAPADVQRRWFVAEGRDFVLDESIRNAVTFEERNVARDDVDLWAPNQYDVVFCRNVIMYFTPEQAQRAVARVTRSLKPGGFLFLGHAETLRGLSQEFHLKHTHATFYYQKRGADEVAGATISFGETVSPIVELDWATTWIDVVQRSSDRIRALADAPQDVRHEPAATPRSRVGLTTALDLLQKERFDEALSLLDAQPQDERNDADVLLLKGVLQTHAGRVHEAEEACKALLSIDELNAGAHYVLALCRESSGDGAGAIEHDKMAAYLDPTFAMPRLHLGLMARRAARRSEAREELGQAVVLLQREDPSRLLLFGGGFNRQGLIALCRAEIDRLGGADAHE